MKQAHDPSENNYTSELRKILPFETFKIAFEKFLEQADENAKSGKSNGEKSLYGLPKPKKGTSTSGKLKVDGGDLGQQFGQGAASRAPYINWHVVSIYYIPATQKIILGIETDRYSRCAS